MVDCGKNAAHHDIAVAVGADKNEAYVCLPRFLANARAPFLVHQVGIENDVATLPHDFEHGVLGNGARLLVAFALFVKLDTNIIAPDDRRTDVLCKLLCYRTLARANEADDGHDDRLLGLALLDVELRHERVLRRLFLLSEFFAFVNHNSNDTRQNELCQLSEHLTPLFLGLISRRKMVTRHPLILPTLYQQNSISSSPSLSRIHRKSGNRV